MTDENKKSSGIKAKPIITIIVCAVAFFIYVSFATMSFEIGIPILLTVVLVFLFLPSQQKRFMKKAEVLPTSKTRSVAMGEVELMGELKEIELLKPPLGDSKCIGFSYFIEEPYRTKEGKTAYRTVHSEEQVNDFYLKDDVGSILVRSENINLLSFDANYSFEKNGQRYSQITFYPKMKIFLIGKATSGENGKPEIVFGSRYESHGIMPISHVEFNESSKPIAKIAGTYAFAFFLTILFFLCLNTSVTHSGIVVNRPIFTVPVFDYLQMIKEDVDYSKGKTNWAKVLMLIDSNPFIMVGIATIGVIALSFVIIGISMINKLLFSVRVNTFSWIVGWSIGLIFFVGFPTQLLLLLLATPPHKMLLIYVFMCLYCIIFATLKVQNINLFSGSLRKKVSKNKK